MWDAQLSYQVTRVCACGGQKCEYMNNIKKSHLRSSFPDHLTEDYSSAHIQHF